MSINSIQASAKAEGISRINYRTIGRVDGNPKDPEVVAIFDSGEWYEVDGIFSNTKSEPDRIAAYESLPYEPKISDFIDAGNINNGRGDDFMLELAQKYVSCGKVNDEDDTGSTLLHYMTAYPDSVKLLIESGADVNHLDKKGNPPIFKMRHNWNDSTAKALIYAGADIRIVNSEGADLDSFLSDSSMRRLEEFLRTKMAEGIMDAGFNSEVSARKPKTI